MRRAIVLLWVTLGCLLAPGCQRRATSSGPAELTSFAELRAIKGTLSVRAPGEAARAPYPRERLVEGQALEISAGGLAWLRRDGGATWLVSGPASLVLHADHTELSRGRAFVDSEQSEPAQITTPGGALELADARASLTVGEAGAVDGYVLRGSARLGETLRVGAGERLTLRAGSPAQLERVLSWQDWTGGLATADAGAAPAPFGIGTVGAREPGQQGTPRFPLVIARLDVKVSIDHDFALTEVDQTFVNPSSASVEGIFSFRTPPRAVLQRFGVDRAGELVFGRIQERADAARRYESQVYAGSEEDPALLEWQGPGVYSARLYPIGPGAERRVVTRYAEWLPRHGARGERRLYVYPMAAEGARGSLPRIEELTVTVDLSRAAATSVRSGMNGERVGKTLVIRDFDVVPRADLALELFDGGHADAVAYRSPHALSVDEAPERGGADFAREVSREEADYVAIPLRAPPASAPPGVDLAIVIDTSAATEPSALAIARNMAASLLAQLGPEDRAALWAGDATLRPVSEGSGSLGAVDAATRERWLGELAAIERGGASDLGTLLTEAASQLDPKRRGAVVYVGDGAPSVGELVPATLRERLVRLPATARVFAAAVGSRPNLAALESVTRGAPLEQVTDAYAAAQAALRLLEAAGRSVWFDARLDLGPGVDRLLPRQLPPLDADETLLVVGRVNGALPRTLRLTGSAGDVERPLTVRRLNDSGDLRRRWGEGRLRELMESGAGRASLVDLGRRFGVISPVTSLYVPTRRELEQTPEPEAPSAEAWRGLLRRWKPWVAGAGEESLATRAAEAPEEVASDEKAEGGAQKQQAMARDRMERGMIGLPSSNEDGGGGAAPPAEARQKALSGAMEFGIIGELGKGSGSAPGDTPRRQGFGEFGSPQRAPNAPAPEAALPDPQEEVIREGNMWGEEVAAPGTRGMPLGGVDALTGELGGGMFLSGIGPLDGGAAAAKKRAAATVQRYEPAPISLGVTPHAAAPCSPAADLPLAERALLWRERLRARPQLHFLVQHYRAALGSCEASDWRARSLLLTMLLDQLDSPASRVQLWRQLLRLSPRAADIVFRALLARVESSTQLKELHEALGLVRIEPELLDALLARARTPAQRLALLRGAAERFADDTELALLVLDAYEDAGDDAGGRAWARALRRRADATSRVRTQVGEYYLRLAARGGGAFAARDAEEARRTFGELVEFAPEDPEARRRLGKLLTAHGLHAEAARQYETLAGLSPDDPSVPLLLASAAQGSGKLEEAVRWLEKAGASAAPDGDGEVAVAARALASTYLAWARDEARRAGASEELARLRSRAAQLGTSEPDAARVLLSWSHPELTPVLWTDALGSMMPAHDNLPLLGVAQALLPGSPAPRVELRLDAEDAARVARLGATAQLTLLIGEGREDERIARADVRFASTDGRPRASVAFRVVAGTLQEESP